MTKGKQDNAPPCVAVLACHTSYDIGHGEVFVISLSKQYCNEILRLMRELEHREDVHYYETHDFSGTYAWTTTILDETDIDTIQKLVEEDPSSVEVRTRVVSKEEVYWQAFMKHSEPPALLQTSTIAKDTLRAIANGAVSDNLLRKMRNGIYG